LIGQNPDQNHKTGLFTITGNLVGSQENNIHLTSARGVTITGNVLYSGHSRNLLVESSRNIVIGANTFDHNPDYEPRELCTGIRIAGSADCALAGLVIQDCRTGRHTVEAAGPQAREGLIELVGCRRINVTGVQVLDPAPNGFFIDNCSDTVLCGCTVLDGRSPPFMQAAVRWQGDGSGNLVTGCRLGRGAAGGPATASHVRLWNNLVGE
jgi:polygalacturonase